MSPVVQPVDILLVDDEPGDVELAKMALAQSPYPSRVTVAANGRLAMNMLRRETPDHAHAPIPDLIFLDLNMPQMNGKDVLRELKADPRLARIPVVVLSTSEAEQDIVSSYSLGASGYVSKPVELEDLFKAIHGVQEYWFNVVRRPGRV